MYIYDRIRRSVSKTISWHTDWVVVVVLSPNQKYLASGGLDNQSFVFEIETGRMLGSLDGHAGCVESLDWSRNGKYIVTCSKDKRLRLWEVKSLVKYRLVKNKK